MFRTHWLSGLLAVLMVALVYGAVPKAHAYRCNINYNLKVDLPFNTSNVNGRIGEKISKYGWKTFLALAAEAPGRFVNLAGDNRTQWEAWSSSQALIRCARDRTNCTCASGSCTSARLEYYPTECQAIEGYRNYRVLGQISKVDDNFLQATVGNLSNTPLIDRNGKFVRYEILVNPVAQKYVIKNKLYDKDVLDGLTEDLTFPCGSGSYKGGDPGNRKAGSFIVKNAWMEADQGSLSWSDYRAEYLRKFHTEDLLVYTPSYRNKSGVATCEKKTMALVGQHIANKTVKQPRWIWTTYEHRSTAPYCDDALPPPGDQQGSTPNLSCPASVTKDYLFYPQKCSADGSDPDACQSCNAQPVSNRNGCTNPNVEDDVSWCLDKPPAAVDGMSRLCRQVNIKGPPIFNSRNNACRKALGSGSVWSRYEQIAVQWYQTKPKSCQSKPTAKKKIILPSFILDPADPTDLSPYLANTTMESDIRSNCMGCHSKATVGDNSVSTDFMYWLQLEAAEDFSGASSLSGLLEKSPH